MGFRYSQKRLESISNIIKLSLWFYHNYLIILEFYFRDYLDPLWKISQD